MMVEYFLPNIRGLVAHELHDRGESQRRIAILLGITQARVSYYLSMRKSKFSLELSNQFGVGAGEVQSYSKILSEDVARSQVDGIFTLYSIWKNLLFSGKVCSLHQNESGISTECSVCMELHRPSRESEASGESEDSIVLRDLSEAVSILENSSTFPLLMPEVSVNVAMARSNPKNTSDVAAIPGRITKTHGRAKAFVLPEFGSSKHMSNVVLIFNSKSSNLRAAMNLRYDEDLEKTLGVLGIARVYTVSDRAAQGGDQVLKRLQKVALPDPTTQLLAIIDRGSEGVEPNTYLIGINASQIAQVALRISHRYANFVRSKA
jgi:predicted fused transcriptional regulator/phosphomethylpyrimidine kinase/predicted transcriptional regulator